MRSIHIPTRRDVSTALVLAAALAALGTSQAPQSPPQPRATWPCANYERGLRGKGNFGVYIDKPGSPFHDSWHLAEDVWLAGGTEVHAIADGVVRYSAFSPTWTDEKHVVHWNLGNVIVIEHAFDPPLAEQKSVCSFYVHLAADRRVQVGDRVKCGDVIGRIGADKSEENGRYPAHLHFGIHIGPYVQIPPAFERELREAARSKDGLRVGPNLVRGEVELTLQNETSVLVRSKESKSDVLLSLLVGSTAPSSPPPEIMCWCQGYGPREMVDEWLAPSKFLRAAGAK